MRTLGESHCLECNTECWRKPRAETRLFLSAAVHQWTVLNNYCWVLTTSFYCCDFLVSTQYTLKDFWVSTPHLLFASNTATWLMLFFLLSSSSPIVGLHDTINSASSFRHSTSELFCSVCFFQHPKLAKHTTLGLVWIQVKSWHNIWQALCLKHTDAVKPQNQNRNKTGKLQIEQIWMYWVVVWMGKTEPGL